MAKAVTARVDSSLSLGSLLLYVKNDFLDKPTSIGILNDLNLLRLFII